MGIFTRFKDIVSANLNSILDSAEDPEKMLKLMIREMEDTLVELKSSCAASMATEKKMGRELAELEAAVTEWENKAALALKKGREDLAREALVLKKNFTERVVVLTGELAGQVEIVAQYKEDIAKLDEKIAYARDKLRILVQRQVKAKEKVKSETTMRKLDSADAVLRFEQYESRIDQLEAEADLINAKRPVSIKEEFANLEYENEIEQELASLKSKLTANKE
jgi:phage shock protein A